MSIQKRLNHIQKELDSIKRNYKHSCTLKKYIIIAGVWNCASNGPALYHCIACCPGDFKDGYPYTYNVLESVSMRCLTTSNRVHDDLQRYKDGTTKGWGDIVFTKRQLECIYKYLGKMPYGNILVKQAKLGTKELTPSMLKYINSNNY